MTATYLFSAANAIALASWVALIIAVILRKGSLHQVFLGRVVPLALALLYFALIVLFFGKAQGGFDSLSNVKLLFTSDWMVLAGWVHYLAFDLFVGCWIADESTKAGLPRWPLLLILPLTFLFGPIGYFAFEASRFLLSRKNEVMS